MSHSPVGPNVLTESCCFIGTILHGRELGSTNSSHHSRGAHRARADSDFDDVGTSADQITCSFFRDHVARDDWRGANNVLDLLDDVQHTLLMTVCRVDDNDIDTHLQQGFGPLRWLSIDAYRDSDHQTSLTIYGWSVDRATQCTFPSDTTQYSAFFIGNWREIQAGLTHEVMDLLDVLSKVDGDHLAIHHVVQLSEPIETHRIMFGKDAFRSSVVIEYEYRTMGALVQQAECLSNGPRSIHDDRSVEHGVSRFDELDHVSHHVDRYVLGQHDEPTTASDRLRHPSPGDGSHVGDDDGNRRTNPIWCGEINAHAAFHLGHRWNEEDIVVGEIEVGHPMQELHRSTSTKRANVSEFCTKRCEGITLEAADSVPVVGTLDCNVLASTDPLALRRTVDLLSHDGIVALPTETVYGLAASITSPRAIQRVYTTKGRPPGHPLIVHIADPDELTRYSKNPSAAALTCAQHCWPGPFTMLVPRTDAVPDNVVGGGALVAIRIPANDFTRSVVRHLGDAIVAPSANLFGHVSPTTGRHVCDDLGNTVDLIVDGGPCTIGVESTIVDFSCDRPTLLRAGGMDVEDIETLLGVEITPDEGPSRAPGMLTVHYQPRARVVLVKDDNEARSLLSEFTASGRRALILQNSDHIPLYASTLYAQMREADMLHCDFIVAVLPEGRGLGRAIRDRLTRAAAH
jgi:L-threonylcarbamoyladenylate synthase